jgi:type III secretion system low calcium response chaperone LcrH/SycD
MDQAIMTNEATMSYEEAVLKLQSLSESTVDDMYASAYESYTNKNESEALVIFQKLVIARPYNKNYWFALASSLQASKKYSAAIKAWAMTSLLDDTDGYPHFHAGECLYFSSDKEQTIKALMEAKKRSRGAPELTKKIVALQKACNLKTKKVRC